VTEESSIIQAPNLEQSIKTIENEIQERRIKMLEDEIQELREAVIRLERKQLFPTFMSSAELAAMLNIQPGTVYDWVSKDKIPFRKAGDRTLFLLSDILKWTKKQANDFRSQL